jgi:hypothetical protein
LLAAAAAAGLLLSTRAPLAKSAGLKAPLAPEKVSLDGLPNEFDGEWRKLTHVDKGSADESDCSAKVALAYDDRGIWVAADVTDDQLVGGGDHLELLLGVPGGTLVSVDMYPGVAGKSRAAVKQCGVPVPGAKIVEAPSGGGYTLEALIPWRAIPKSATLRVGYRGAIFLHDADSSRVPETVIGTADSHAYSDLPPISMAAELSLGSGLLRKRNIVSAPKQNLLANVVGDKLLERVLVYDRYLVILGPGYRGGAQYYFRDLEAKAGRGDLIAFQVKDLTGDGRSDLLIRKRVRGAKGSVEVMEILSYHPGGETPTAIFAQEVVLDLGGKKVANEVRLVGGGRQTRITLAPGKSEGVDPSRFRQVSNTGANPVLVPWGSIASQTYGLRDGRFVVIDEKTQEATGSSVQLPGPSPSSSPSPKGASWQNKPAGDAAAVYAHYKKQRNVSGRARFDLSADLAEGDDKERLVIHGRDLVVFGSGFRGGRGFAAVELASFEKAADIQKVTTRDLTRDGKHEILIRGVIRSPLPEDLGGGSMRREVIMVYKASGAQFERIFAAELARNVGNKRVEAKLTFKKGKYAIQLEPGRAKGYDEGTYPWRQKDGSEGDFEPLLLPWGGIKRVLLHFDGTRFVR